MNKLQKIGLAAAVILLVLVSLARGSFFIVQEGEQVVIVRFGEMVRTIDHAGLNAKFPVFDQKVKFLKKTYSWNSTGERVPTSTKQYIMVALTARWNIADLEKFYRELKSKREGERILDQVIESAIKTVVGEYDLIETVRSSNDILQGNEEIGSVNEGLQEIEKGRHMLAGEIFAISAPKVKDYGLELKDVVILSSNYSSEVKKEVLQTMISEREKMAILKERDGDGEKEKWLGRLSRDEQITLSEARAKAEKLKGEGDADAASIYNRAYSKSPEFFRFWRTMESYKTTMNSMDITLTTDMDYFDYLYGQSGR